MIPKSSSPRSNEVIENAPELPIQQNPYSHFAGGVPFSGNRDREALTERKFKGSGGFVAKTVERWMHNGHWPKIPKSLARKRAPGRSDE
jgi:hypothetical protein